MQINIKKQRELLKSLLRQLYPDRCPVCNRALSDTLICPECAGKLVYIKQPVCCLCGKPLEDMQREYCSGCMKESHVFKQGRAVWLYQGQMRRILYRYKYGNRRDYTEFFAVEAYRIYGGWIRTRGFDAVIPIPLHKKRKRRRGYNQAELFAARLSELSHIPLEAGLLKRVRNTVPQKKLSGKERKNNLKKAFKIEKNIVKLERVLLVDDIYTTGSTLDAAASVLKQAGIVDVYVLCISIGGGL